MSTVPQSGLREREGEKKRERESRREGGERVGRQGRRAREDSTSACAGYEQREKKRTVREKKNKRQREKKRERK